MPYLALGLLVFFAALVLRRLTPSSRRRKVEHLLEEGRLALERGDDTAAEGALTAALEHAAGLPMPADLGARLKEASGDLAYLQQAWEKARSEYKTGMEILQREGLENSPTAWRLTSSLSFTRLGEGRERLFLNFQNSLLQNTDASLSRLRFFIDNAGRLYQEGQSQLALQFLQRTLVLSSDLDSEADPERALALRGIAAVYKDLEKYKEAAEALQAARNLVPLDPRTQEGFHELFELGNYFDDSGQVQEAYDVFLDLRNTLSYSSRIPSLPALQVCHRLAEISEKLGDWEKMLSYAETGRKYSDLLTREELFDEAVREELVELLQILTDAYEKSAKPEQALETAGSLVSLLASFGYEEKVADTQLRQARLAAQTGNFTLAMSSLEAVGRHWEHLGEVKKSDLAFLLQEKSWVLEAGGDFHGALNLLDEAESTLGPDPDPEELGDLWDARANTFMNMDDPGSAESAWEKAEAIYLQVHPATSSWVLHCRLGRAGCHMAFGEYKEALELLGIIREESEETTRSNPFFHADILSRVADAYIGLGEWEKGLPPAREAVSVLDAAPNQNAPATLRALWQLAFLLEKTGELAEAEEICNTVLERAAGAGQEGGEDVFHALSSLAEIQRAKNDWPQALVYAERALVVAEALGKIREEDRAPLREILANAQRRLH